MKSKIVTLAEEVKRRMSNMDRKHSKEERIEELKKFSQKMCDLAYTRENREEIFKAGLKRYYRLLLIEKADCIEHQMK